MSTAIAMVDLSGILIGKRSSMLKVVIIIRWVVQQRMHQWQPDGDE
jgi:hypothetical protein